MRRIVSVQFLIEAAALAVIFVCPAALPARAQIVLVNDGNGRLVFANEENPAPERARPRGHLRQPSPEINKLVEASAERHHVDPKLVRAVIQVESNYNPAAYSNKGAMGLMQLIPSTAQRFGVRNPYNPKQNIEGGVNYLKYLLDLFKGDVTLSLAAYNAGENAVMRHGSVPRIPETVNYVRKVRSLYGPGAKSGKLAAKSKPEAPVTIYRYVDAAGVVHYTDGDDL